MFPINPGRNDKLMLIIDPDIEFLLELKRQTSGRREEAVLFSRSDQAIEAIDRLREKLRGVLLNPKLEDGKTVPVVIRRVLRVSPQTPIFYFCDPREHRYEEAALKTMMVRQVILRTSNLNEIIRAVQMATENFDANEAMKAAAQFNDLLDAEVNIHDDQFSPIIATNFVSGSISHFDLYVRLKKDRFVKILQSGDIFSKERLDRYLEKGVEFFYIRKAAQESYLKFCETLASGALATDNASMDIKVGFTLNQGEETIRFMKNCGLKSNVLKHVKLFVANVQQMLAIANLGSKTHVTNFCKDVALRDHGVTTTIMSSLMLKPLSFSIDKSVKIVGLASLLHDIALAEGRLLDVTDQDSLTGPDRELFLNHPTAGAKMAAELPGIEPVIIQAIEQHHERRTRSGFPRQIGIGDICMVGEIVGLADEFSRLVRTCSRPDSKMTDPLLQMENNVLRGFSHPVADAFRQAFRSR
jgi:HD-GYP domain-containing protein (c-di-GMP phosphodiesterase class II)